MWPKRGTKKSWQLRRFRSKMKKNFVFCLWKSQTRSQIVEPSIALVIDIYMGKNRLEVFVRSLTRNKYLKKALFVNTTIIHRFQLNELTFKIIHVFFSNNSDKNTKVHELSKVCYFNTFCKILEIEQNIKKVKRIHFINSNEKVSKLLVLTNNLIINIFMKVKIFCLDFFLRCQNWQSYQSCYLCQIYKSCKSCDNSRSKITFMSNLQMARLEPS